MEETKNTQTRPAGETSTEQAKREREAEATSSETLSDVEESGKAGSKGSVALTAEGDSTPTPAPDGMPGGAPGSRADGSDVGGPM